MAKATAHPDRRLISSEDVEGTEVYGSGDEVVGEIDHLLIEKVSGRVAYAVMSFGGFLGLAHSHYPYPGRRSNMIPRSVAIVPGSVKSSLEMLRPSATTHGPTGIGRHALINITAVLPTGDELPRLGRPGHSALPPFDLFGSTERPFASLASSLRHQCRSSSIRSRALSTICSGSLSNHQRSPSGPFGCARAAR